MKNPTISFATVKCLAINKETGKESNIEKLDIVVTSREDLAKPLQQAKLIKMRELGNRTEEWTVSGRCTCSDFAHMLAVKKPNQEAFTLRDKHVGQHASVCPLFKPVVHLNSEGKKVGIKPSMLELPSKKKGNEKKTKQSKAASTAVVDGAVYETIKGMFATTFDLSCHLSNERFSNFVWSGFNKTHFKQVMDLPYAGKTLRCFKEDAKKTGKKVSVDIQQFSELKVSSYDGTEVYKLDNNLTSKLERCPGSLFKIIGTCDFVRGDILLNAIKGLKIFNNYIQGPYIMVAISVKEKGRFYKTPILYFQPVHIGKNAILPVESDLERQCISILGDLNDVKLYKPTSYQKGIFKRQLESFFGVLSLAKKEYFEIIEQYEKTNDGNFVRPDLFVKHKGKVLVFEIAGMMNRPEYVTELLKKENFFYADLKEIKYYRVESVEEIQIVLESY